MKKIRIGIRDFALPVPRTGSIEALSGYTDSQARGLELHQRLQKQKAQQSPNYQAEVSLTHEFHTGRYIFEVCGRMDGLYASEKTPHAKIEEIKSAFQLNELKSRLTHLSDHPYALQLKTYGYIYWLQNKILPELNFHLISTRNYKSHILPIKFDVDEYGTWLKLRLAELDVEAQLSEARVLRRQNMGAKIEFPFEHVRAGQMELVGAVDKGMREQQHLLIQAPTGLGKTVGVIYPTLKEAMARGQKLIYLTPKNSQHAVAEDALERFREKGQKVKALTITAKSKICMKNETLCNPDYCEYAKNHYAKVYENKIPELLAKKKKLTAKVFKKLAKEFEVCPFEIQLDAAQDADVVICDYNYAFAPRSAFGRLAANGLGEEGKPNLVIDEAHNLPSRAMGYYSPELSCEAIKAIGNNLLALPNIFKREMEEHLNQCLEIIRGCRLADSKTGSDIIEAPAELFFDQDATLKEFLARYLDSDIEIEKGDPVMRLCFYWSEFSSALEFVVEGSRKEFFTTFQATPAGGKIKITCCDASSMLQDKYDDYESVVGFSATLKPFNFYSRLSGLESDKLRTAEFLSPFPKEQRKILVIPQLSSKYSDRARNYPKIADAIQKISELKSGNYLAFFPSFDFLENVLARFQTPPGFAIFKQTKYMKIGEVEETLEYMKSQVKPTILFAVQGGVFSEGVDYMGDMVIGAFVVGTPLPIFDLEREQMRKYYQDTYEMGFDYAYTYPAMTKSVQAAGRVIRSENDKGIIILMDHRFTDPNYVKSMPQDWFEDDVHELVSGQILKEVKDFWAGV